MDYMMVKFYHYSKFHKIFKVSIWWMIYCSLLNLCSIWNFHDKKCVMFSSTSFGTLKYYFVIQTTKVLSFLNNKINSSVIIECGFLLLIIWGITSSKTINTLGFFPRFYNSLISILHIIWIFSKIFTIIIIL